MLRVLLWLPLRRAARASYGELPCCASAGIWYTCRAAAALCCPSTNLAHMHAPLWPLQIKRQLTKAGIVSGRAKEKGLMPEQVGGWR